MDAKRYRSCRVIVLFFIGIVLLFPTLSSATGDGSEGLTSTGNESISLTVGNLVRITGIGDLSLNYSGSGATTLNDNVCIYTNNSSGNYTVTPKGNGDSSAFTVTSGTSTISYTFKWNDSASTGGVQVNANTTSAVQNNADTNSQSCASSGGENANYEVIFTKNALMSVPAGTYTGTITLVIQPEVQ